jgi:hypothetical protein
MVKSGFLAASAGILLLCTAGSATAASIPAASLGDVAKSGVVDLVEDVQFGGRRVGGGRVGGGRVGGGRVAGGRIGGGGFARGGGRRWGRGVGAGVAAGVIGGLIGGALMNANPSYAAPAPVYEEPVYVAPRGGGAVEYCMRRYRSYDPRTGTYVGYDGIERPCP